MSLLDLIWPGARLRGRTKMTPPVGVELAEASIASEDMVQGGEGRARPFLVEETRIKELAIGIVEHRDELPEYFVDALTLTPDDHLRVLKSFQDHIDNSISKTVNVPG